MQKKRTGAVAPAFVGLLGFLWLSVTLVGLGLLTRYAGRAGEAGNASAWWPSRSKLPKPTQRAALIVSVHPHCACSRATVHELARIMAHTGDRLDATVLFWSPETSDQAWVETDLWRNAQAIPHVTVWRDQGGHEAKQFGAQTSGQATFYDPSGHLRFQGGITAARGHEGDNVGADTILALLREERNGAESTAVFGCPLQNRKP